jgi:hypothetical protein
MKPYFRDGQRVKFYLNDNSAKEFAELYDDGRDEEFFENLDGRTVTIKELATDFNCEGDEPTKDSEYYDIETDDGELVRCVSGYNLENWPGRRPS